MIIRQRIVKLQVFLVTKSYILYLSAYPLNFCDYWVSNYFIKLVQIFDSFLDLLAINSIHFL
jgi:hypothetical protein